MFGGQYRIPKTVCVLDDRDSQPIVPDQFAVPCEQLSVPPHLLRTLPVEVAMLSRFARCRRGSVALMTTIALLPLIALTGFGAEAGMWYVTQRHAQNAADAAAYSAA